MFFEYKMLLLFEVFKYTNYILFLFNKKRGINNLSSLIILLSSDVYCIKLKFNYTIYNLVIIIYIKIILCKYKLIYSWTKTIDLQLKIMDTEISYFCRVTCTVVA